LEQLYIFGASKRGELLLELITNHTNDVVISFIDNNAKKIGNNYFGKPIIGVGHFLKYRNGKIIIASMYHTEIEKQLMEEGLKRNEDYNIDYEYLSDKIHLSNDEIPKNRILEDEELLILTLPNGNVLGGLEKWSKDVYEYAIKLNKKPILYSFTLDEQYYSTKDYNEIIFNRSTHNIFEITKRVCLELIKYKKATVILNYSIETIMAISVLKRYGLNEHLKVISVVHIDHMDILNYNLICPDVIHSFLCVSDEIREKLLRAIPGRSNDIYSKISPISSEFMLNKTRKYSSEKESIRLGYASRLEDYQKRSSDILKLCDLLDASTINYTIEVAGSGSLENLIKSSSKIDFKGRISSQEIREFWANNDIFLNFSDTEGTSLSMIEAMSQGAIPIVTKVSGVKALITESNGRLVEVGDIAQMVKYIEELYFDRSKLPLLGETCVNTIRASCDEKCYYEFLFSL